MIATIATIAVTAIVAIIWKPGLRAISKGDYLHGIHDCHEAEQELCVDFFVFDKPVNDTRSKKAQSHLSQPAYTLKWKHYVHVEQTCRKTMNQQK